MRLLPLIGLFCCLGATEAFAQCAMNETQVTAFSDDLETGAAGWTHSGTGDTWALSAAQTSSGSNAWFAVDPDTLSDQRLLSPPIVVPTGLTQLRLRFMNRQSFEVPNADGRCWDAGILESSIDSGSSFLQVPAALITLDPYDNIIWNDTPGNNPITVDYGPTTAWCSDAGGAFTSVEVDASGFAGQTVQFRWRLGSDSAAGNEGWYVDDVSLSGCRASSADLSISKTNGVTSSTAGTTTVYTITASNAGPDGVTGATVADTFAAPLTGCSWTCIGTGGTCTAAGSGNINDSVNLPNAASVTYTATCTIDAAATGMLSNTAAVSSAITDAAPGNNSATDTDTLTAPTMGVLGVQSATLDFGAPTVGTSEQRTLIITNTGDGPLTVSGLSAVTAPFTQIAGGSCGAVSFILTAGSSCTVLYQFTPPNSSAFTQQVTVSSDVGDVVVTLSGQGVVAIPVPLGGQWLSGLMLVMLSFTALLTLRRRG